MVSSVHITESPKHILNVLLSSFASSGKEKDEETGYGYFGARYMDHELMSSFISLDRFAEKYPSMSPYHYCMWNPIKFIDPSGDSAWAITNSWNDHYISQYRDRVKDIGQKYRETGQKYTCEDFALSVLIDFASEHGLPVKIANGTGVYDARSNAYSDVESFKNDVLKSTGARDLQSKKNTLPTNKPSSGDIVVNRHANGMGHHIQLVQGGDQECLFLYQGNSNFLNSVPGASRLGASSPGSLLYAGKGIELAVYNTKTDYYTNVTTRKSTAGFSAKANIEYRKWNFYGF